MNRIVSIGESAICGVPARTLLKPRTLSKPFEPFNRGPQVVRSFDPKKKKKHAFFFS